MITTIYMNKETEGVFRAINPPLSLLVREILLNHDLAKRPIRVRRVAPAVIGDREPGRPVPEVLELEGTVLDGETVLYEPTVADLDAIGATSAVVEWYDIRTDSWRASW